MGIKFGTSGWRAIIADEFTFHNVRIVTQSIANLIKKERLHNNPVIIGCDTRFMGKDFMSAAAAVLAGNGLQSLICTEPTPTPVLAFEVLKRKAAGAINITASHNPPEYSGLKFSPSWGGPALPETTEAIEEGCHPYLSDMATYKTMNYNEGIKKKLIIPIDPHSAYLKHIKQFIDTSVIKKSRIKIVLDPLHGTGKGYLDSFLESLGCNLTKLHSNRDVLFSGHAPDPTIGTLKEMEKILKKTKANIGLATDGDADRFGVMDSDGTILTANEIIPLVIHHLVRNRKWKGMVARSVMTTHFIDALAQKYNLEVRETPVGFKYIGDIMVKESSVYPSKDGGFLAGGEESGGITIKGHVPEKDGILACLLMAEISAVTKKPLRHTLKKLYSEVGPYFTLRLNFKLPSENMLKIKETLKINPPTELAGMKVKRIVETDGHKFILNDNSWMGIRLSGTEPIVRLYLEADSKEKITRLAAFGRKFLKVK